MYRSHVPVNHPQSKHFKHSSDNKEVTHTPNEYISKNPPKFDNDVWEAFNKEFSDNNKSSWTALKKSQLTPEQYVSDLNGMLASFLLSKKEFKN